jgi:TrmH family RNA methyltransferase
MSLQITGRHHPLAKRIRAMVRSGLLLDDGEVLLETPNLIEDALRSGIEIRTALIRSDATPAARVVLKRLSAATKIYEIGPSVFSSLSTTENNPGILALAVAPVWKVEDLFAGGQPLVVVLAGLQDPGNLGTILRAAEAFGATGILTTKGTVSPFNAKAIRAAAGSLFRLPRLLNLTPQQIVALLRRKNVSLLSGVAKGGKPVEEMVGKDGNRGIAVAFGSEGAGLPRELDAAGTAVSIPMARQVESLNVATAASVMLYEIARQRAAHGEARREE